MFFDFETPWCTCGKPFSLQCKQPIPADFFADLSVDAAKFAHHCYVDETTRRTTLSAHKDDDGAFVVDEEQWKITPPDAFVDVRAHSELRRTFPSRLDANQCALLEERDWGGFLATLDEPVRQIDVLVLGAGSKIVARIIKRHAFAQINVGGEVFLSGVKGSCGPCSWTTKKDRAPSRITTPLGTFDTILRDWIYDTDEIRTRASYDRGS